MQYENRRHSDQKTQCFLGKLDQKSDTSEDELNMSKLKNGIGINFDILYRIGKLKGHAAPQVILASNEEGTIEIGDRTRVQRCHGKDVTARREITMKVLSRLRRRSSGFGRSIFYTC